MHRLGPSIRLFIQKMMYTSLKVFLNSPNPSGFPSHYLISRIPMVSPVFTFQYKRLQFPVFLINRGNKHFKYEYIRKNLRIDYVFYGPITKY